MLLDFADDVDGICLNLNRVVDIRQMAIGEFNIDDRTDDLNDFADFLLGCDFGCHVFLSRFYLRLTFTTPARRTPPR
jgi:hypothetical protein